MTPADLEDEAFWRALLPDEHLRRVAAPRDLVRRPQDVRAQPAPAWSLLAWRGRSSRHAGARLGTRRMESLAPAHVAPAPEIQGRHHERFANG